MALSYFEEGDEVYMRAQQIWQILTGWVKLECQDGNLPVGLISYESLGKYMQYSHRSLGRPLGIIALLCRNDELPSLNTVVVRKDSQKPGDGVIFSGELTEDQTAVLKYNWFQIATPGWQVLAYIHESRDGPLV
ncbi:hypothetical protein SAMN05421538_103220 [Paracoccus isoporae]|uniref:Uncharacterized protein n=1 Tax=Paracoccus isoporae TaxID=591205 RepID=A0A1G6ZD02_9RHOB|nr:hypothetical protein [Paracoccus isoporae]SDE00332.1 hypothetical protein SAMN05421538_103220 [Paracoccus isoporae]